MAMCGRYGFSKRAINKITQKMRLKIDGAIALHLDRYRKATHTPVTPGPVVGPGKLEMLRLGFVGMPRPRGGALLPPHQCTL